MTIYSETFIKWLQIKATQGVEVNGIDLTAEIKQLLQQLKTTQ